MENRAAPLPRQVKILGGTSLLNDVASEMIYPLLPMFLFSLGGSKSVLGIIEGAADSTASLLKLATGRWSDRAGRRKGFVLVGYGLACVVRPLLCLITLPWQLFAIRFTDRVGKGIRTAPRDALIADATPPEQHGRAFGFHHAMDHLGAALGPLLSAGFLFLWPEELRLLFFLTVIPGTLVMALLVWGLREEEKHPGSGLLEEAPPPAIAPGHPARAGLNPAFFWYLTAVAVFTLGNSSDAFLLVRLQELGVPVYLLPVLWCGLHVLKSASSYLVGPYVDRVGPRPFLVVGWLVYAAIYLGMGLAGNAWEASFYFLSYAFFFGLTEPAQKAMVTRLVGAENKGLAFGWFHCALGIAALPASVLFGVLYQSFGSLVPFCTGAGLAVAATLLLVAVRSKK